ncbi:MAG: HDIG domain-containing protein [Nitrospirae bacterium]|nr:HDIG domain-containing protein [Nitrospirota bacterium]
MKNVMQKIPKAIKKVDAKKYSLLIVFGFLSAISIQQKTGVEYLLGGFLMTCILLIILYRDILRYKPSYLKNYNMLVLLGFMIVSTLLIGRFFEYLLTNLARGLGSIPLKSTLFGIPIPAGAMLVTLLFDFHTAIVFSFIVSLLSGLWLNDAMYPFYAFVGSLTAAFSVIRCKKRSAILRGGFYVGIANAITAGILLLFAGEFISVVAAPSVVFALLSGLSVIAIVSVILPILEYMFKVTTDISLLELLDLEQPLMKNLMIAAPGTYHHSVIVGNLVESAAETIGVNPLLARVSAYYHDIGKIKMPEYFVENQSGSLSKHDKLTPHMSSMIIASHVKEGVEFARQYKLPEPLIDIIQQHHGTGLMAYFYQKAKVQEGENRPTEEEYRYPGPKPQTRITALVMMADAVEAASRVLHDVTPARIAALVDRIINHIFLDGQLDECELTLKDISEIKRRFSYILTGILHKRIDYPGFDFNAETNQAAEGNNEKGINGEKQLVPQNNDSINKKPATTDQNRFPKNSE